MQSPHALYSDAFPREYGHAFWLLEPNDLPYEYFVQGVQIGDVLVLTPDGGYDYLFNICRPKDDPVNAGRTYEGFEPLPLDLVLETSTRARWQNAGSCLGSSGGKMFSASASASAPGLPVPVGAGVGFSTSHSSGALLILPDGASRTDLRNHRRFKDWITRNIHTVFEHVNGDQFGREASSVFIVTGCDKSTESFVAASTNASDVHKAWLNLNVANVGVDLSYSSSLQCPSSTRVTPVTHSNDGTKNKNHCAFARGLTCTKRRYPIRSRITIKVGDLSTDQSWDVEDKSGSSSFWPFSSFRSRSSSSSGRSSGSSPPSSTPSSTRSTPAPSPTSSCEDLSNPSPCPDLICGDSDDESDSQYQSDDDGEIHLSFPRTSRRDPWTEMNEHFLRLHPDYDYVISHTNDLPHVPEQVPLMNEDNDVSLAVHEVHPEHTSNQSLDSPKSIIDPPSQLTRTDEDRSFRSNPDPLHPQDSSFLKSQHRTTSLRSAGTVRWQAPELIDDSEQGKERTRLDHPTYHRYLGGHRPSPVPKRVRFASLFDEYYHPEAEIEKGSPQHPNKDLLPKFTPAQDLTAELTIPSQFPVASGGFSDVYRGSWLTRPVAVKVLTGKSESTRAPAPAEDSTSPLRISKHGSPLRPPYPSLARRSSSSDGHVNSYNFVVYESPFKSYKHLCREALLLDAAEHPFLGKFYGTAVDSRPAPVLKRYDNGDASSSLQSRSMAEKIDVIKGIATGLEYLHSKKVVHGDLKGTNVLISDSSRVVLSDFGISRCLETPTGFSSSLDDFRSLHRSNPSVRSKSKSGAEIPRGSPSSQETYSATNHRRNQKHLPAITLPYIAVPYLHGLAGTLGSIYDTLQQVETHRTACQNMTQRCSQLLRDLEIRDKPGVQLASLQRDSDLLLDHFRIGRSCSEAAELSDALGQGGENGIVLVVEAITELEPERMDDCPSGALCCVRHRPKSLRRSCILLSDHFRIGRSGQGAEDRIRLYLLLLQVLQAMEQDEQEEARIELEAVDEQPCEERQLELDDGQLQRNT